MASIKTESDGEILTVHINELHLLDEMTIQQVYKDVMSVVEKTQESNVLLHFGRVSFMSSSALGMLIRVHKKCRELKIALRLSNMCPNVREVFKITELDKLFEIYPDAADAIQSFKRPPGTAGVFAKIEPLGPDPMRPYGGPVDRELRQREKKEPDA